MTLEKIMRTCRAIKIIRKLNGGGGQIRANHVAWWMSQSKSQAYRDLIRMEQLGLVTRVESKYKNTKAIDWFLTEKGFSIADSKELLNYE